MVDCEKAPSWARSVVMSWPLSCSPWCHSVVERCKSLSRKNIFIVLGLSQWSDCIIYNYFNKEILWLEFSSRCQFVGREIYTWYGLQSFQYHMVPPYWWMGKRDVIDWKRPPWRFLRRSVSGHRRPCQPGGGIRLRVEAYLMLDIKNGRGAWSFL